MVGEVLAGLVGEAAFGRLGRSQRAQVAFRVGFGLLGFALGVAGAIHFWLLPEPITNLPMYASMIALFINFACFWLFNVAMKRRWRWPGLGTIMSFVALFATRILFGPRAAPRADPRVAGYGMATIGAARRTLASPSLRWRSVDVGEVVGSLP